MTFFFRFVVLFSWTLTTHALTPPTHQPPEGNSALTGNSCPKWMEGKDIPPCPTVKQAALLSDNYPALAHVVSDSAASPYAKAEVGEAFAEKFVLETLEAAGDRTPLMFLIVTDKTLQKIQKTINEKNGLDKIKKMQWLSSLKKVESGRFPWQQDYFEAITSKTTNKPVLMDITGYKRGNDTSALFGAMTKACKKISIGEGFEKEKGYAFDSARMGGNMEALPGGLCLHGSNQPSNFAKSYCTSEQNEVVIDTSWLRVGHADEIVGTIPKPGAPFPCNFSLVFANTEKGIAALKSPEHRNDFFFENPAKVEREKAWETGSLRRLCFQLLGFNDEKKKSEPNNENRVPRPIPEELHLKLWNFFIKEAWAGLTLVDVENDHDNRHCAQTTNNEVATFLENNSNWKLTQHLIQEKMDKIKTETIRKVKERLPQCPVDAFDVPYLFETGQPVKDPNEDKYSLPNKMALSLIPNTANAVVSEDTVLVPEPHNTAFKNEIEKIYKKASAKTRYIDTYHYAHTQQGNLHCATHTIRTCQ